MKIKIVCDSCGGGNIYRDAWAVWDTEEQKWILGPVFDAGFCEDCDDEVKLHEVEGTP